MLAIAKAILDYRVTFLKLSKWGCDEIEFWKKENEFISLLYNTKEAQQDQMEEEH